MQCDTKFSSMHTHTQYVHLGNLICLQNKLGDTPLHAAAWKNHAGAVKMLLDKGNSYSYFILTVLEIIIHLHEL